MEFPFDVFLSYSSIDRDWARRLNESLKRAGAQYRIFFDYESLRAGDEWETKIQSSLESSQHLIVVWSDEARNSDWVSRELWTFFAVAKPRTSANRRLICLNLQGMNQATKPFQQVNRPELLAAYRDPAKLADAIWTDIVLDIEEGLNPQKRPLQVPLVVLTLTQPQLAQLGADRWDGLKRDLHLSDLYLRPRYGVTREQWRPFASTATIAELLENIRVKVNAALPDLRLYWQAPEERFWIDAAAAREFVAREFTTAELSVLVIDPVALYHPDTFQRLMLFQDCLASNRTVIIALPPFRVPPRMLWLRNALMNRGMPYFDDYFQPTVPPRRRLAAQCGWNVSDSNDIQRLILAAAGQLGPGRERASGSVFIRHGAPQ